MRLERPCWGRLLPAAVVGAAAFSLAATAGLTLAFAQQRTATPHISVIDLVEECDVLASHPDDPQRMAEGVDDDKIVPRLAILACEDAMKHQPDDARFAFQLGRAVLAKGEKEKALKLFQEAAKKGHAAAYGYIGDAYQFGHGAEIDPKSAYENYQKAVELGFKVAERQLDQLNFDPVLFAADHLNALFQSDLERLTAAAADASNGVGVRTYLFSLTQQLMEACEGVVQPANLLGYYNIRFKNWSAQDDEKPAVTVQGAVGQHDAKIFLRRYGCAGPVAKHIFANLNKLFEKYR